MASKDTKPTEKTRDANAEPEWARGLRDLYDDVVDEPLPTSFRDLLAKLDQPGK